MGLTSEKSYNEILKLYNMGFDANSLCDRMAYTISITFNMPKFGYWFHHQIAHRFVGDLFSDGIEAFGEIRGDLFYRDAVPKHAEVYTTISSMMYTTIMKIADIEEQCTKTILTCASDNDTGYEDYLREINMKNLAPLMKQITVLYEAIKAYEASNDLHKWGKDYKAWLISELQEI